MSTLIQSMRSSRSTRPRIAAASSHRWQPGLPYSTTETFAPVCCITTRHPLAQTSAAHVSSAAIKRQAPAHFHRLPYRLPPRSEPDPESWLENGRVPSDEAALRPLAPLLVG